MTWPKKAFGIVLLAVVWSGAPATATAPPDSLRRVLADTRRPDTLRAQAAAQLARAETDQLRALRLFEQALALAPASAPHLRLELLTQLAVAQGKSGDLASALRTQQQHLALARRLRNPGAQVAALHNMAVVAESLNDLPGAIGYFEQALAVPGAPLSDRLLAQAALSQTLAYSERPNGTAQAERLSQKTLAEAEPAFAANKISRTAYNTVAMLAGRMLLENDHAPRGVALARRELARLAPLLLGDRPDPDDMATAADLQLTLADGLLMQERYADAAREAKASLVLARQTRLPGPELNLLPTLVTALEKAGDLAGALRYQRRLGHLTDSLTAVARTQEAQRLQTQFETREKEARIRSLAQRAELAQARAARQQQRVWALVAVVAALVAGAAVGAWLFVRLRRSQQRLQRVTGLKDQLFAIIGHDLRAPVAGFQQVAPLLHGLAAAPDPAELRELAHAFEQNTTQLVSLLDNMLHWGRVQTQALAPQPEAVAFAALLADESRLLHATAAAKQVRIRLDVPPDLPSVRTDATLLRVIVRNLLANAVKYSRPGGEVTLAAAAAAAVGHTRISVRDTGIGMSAATLAAVLHPDAPRRSRRGTAGEPGTGLGLRVSLAFARELGATLTAESQPGQGTTFGLTLPVG